MADKSRTLIQPLPEDVWNEAGLWELCIEESAGCGLPHRHEYGHDFPMTREELVVLREQIDTALASGGIV
jgi:hypothetical protein